jgi:hypothetical protein
MKISIGFSALIVSMMLLIAMVMPATACVPGTITNESKVLDDFDIETEDGFGQLSGLLQVSLNEDARTAIKDLHNKGYKLQYSQANITKMSPKASEAEETLIIEIPAKAENSDTIGMFVFVSNGIKTIVGNTITEYGEDYVKINVFETTNGIAKSSTIENQAGVISIDGKPVIKDGKIINSESIIPQART